MQGHVLLHKNSEHQIEPFQNSSTSKDTALNSTTVKVQYQIVPHQKL